MAERILSENSPSFHNASCGLGVVPLLAAGANAIFLADLMGAAWRKVELYLSVLSFVVGLMVLIPVGLALAPFILAYSHLGFARPWALKKSA